VPSRPDTLKKYEEFLCREDFSSCIREVVGHKVGLVTRYLGWNVSLSLKTNDKVVLVLRNDCFRLNYFLFSFQVCYNSTTKSC